MLTYSPSSNLFMGQIGPFIDMYIRRTVLNDSNPIKRSLSRSDILGQNLSLYRLDKKKY